jgi:hypothetical protein
MQKECRLLPALFLHYYYLFLPDEKVQAIEIDLTALGLFLPDENIQAIEIDLHCARSISA